MLDDAEITEYENNQPIDPDTNIIKVGTKHVSAMSDTANLQHEFWSEFNRNAYTNNSFSKLFSLRKPYPQHWYDLSIGSSQCHICLTASRQKKQITASLYITDGDELYNKLLTNKQLLEEAISSKLEWRGEKKHKRIITEKEFDVDHKEEWITAFNWLYDMSIKIYQAVKQVN